MKVPVSWLRDYVAIEMPLDELSHRLAVTSCEVERVSRRGIPRENGNHEHFVVGLVLSAEKHPNADRLQLCKVDVGEAEPAQIVCGAWNFGAGATVAVARPGSQMPDGLVLDRRKLRGELSEGMILSERELELSQDHDGILILAAPGDVHIHFRARTDAEPEAEALLAAVADPIVALLGDRIYSDDGATLEESVGRLLLKHGATLATAESLTAGLLGARVTETSGSSAYYVGGFQTYTNAMKTQLLGVDPAVLAEHTAVSEPVAIAMAQGARERTRATYALSLTGYAEGDQAGLVYCGLATPTGVQVRKLKLFGDRHRVRSLAVIQSLDWLRKTLL